MSKSPINGWGARSIMGDKHDLVKFEVLNHGIEIPHLIGCGIRIPERLLRGSPPKKIKRDDTARRGEGRDKTVVEMQIIGKAMHQDDGRILPSGLSCREMIGTAFDDLFGGEGFLRLWLGCGLSHVPVPPCTPCGVPLPRSQVSVVVLRPLSLYLLVLEAMG